MRIVIGILLTLAAVGLVKRSDGKWYEYLAVVIIGVLVIIGLCLL